MQKTIPIEYDELVLLYDSWLNYQAFLKYFYEEEHTLEEAKEKVIKANWDEVPAKYAGNSVLCAEHMIEEIYGVNVEDVFLGGKNEN